MSAGPEEPDPRQSSELLRGRVGEAPASQDVRVRERTAELTTMLEWMKAEEAQRRGAEDAARLRAEKLQRLEAALLQLVTARQTDVDCLLQDVTEVVARAMDLDRVAIWLLNDTKSELRCRALFSGAGGTDRDGLIIRAVDCPKYFAALEKRLAIAAADVTTDERTHQLSETFLAAVGVRALLAVPLRLEGAIAGVLSHGETRGVREWAQEEVDFASAVGGIVALALEADLRRKSEAQLHALAAHLQTVREEERAALARELHDVLGQILTALRMDTAWLSRACREQPERITRSAPERLGGMKELIDEAIATVQRMSSELRPTVLDQLGLVPAVENHIMEFERRSGIAARFIPPESALNWSDRHTIVLYRTLQEALTNVARHSGATQVEVELLTDGVFATLRVQDNGIGMPDGAADQAQSLGLIGMRERAAALGGNVSFSNIPAGGTAVTIRLPLASSDR